MTQTNLSKKQTHRQREQPCDCQGGCQGGEMDWELGVSRCTEWINNRVLLHSTGNCIQYLAIYHNGKEFNKQCIYTYN